MSYPALFSWLDVFRLTKTAVFCLLFLPGPALNSAKAQTAEGSQVDFQKGLEAFSNQWYAQAFDLWSQAEAPQWSGDWCGYTAQAAWKAGKPAEAIRWAYRGLRVEPTHAGLRKELKFMLSSQQLTSEMPLEPPHLFWQTSIDTLGQWAVLWLWVALCILLGHHLLPIPAKVRRLFPAFFGLLLLLSLSFFGLAWGRYLWMHRTEAVTALSSVVLRDAPEDTAQEIQRLKVGQRLRCIETKQEWHKVRLTNEVSGWVRSDQLLPILPESKP